MRGLRGREDPPAPLTATGELLSWGTGKGGIRRGLGKMPSVSAFLPHFQQLFPVFLYKYGYFTSPCNVMLQICQCNEFSAVWRCLCGSYFDRGMLQRENLLEKGTVSLWESTFPIFLLPCNVFCKFFGKFCFTLF